MFRLAQKLVPLAAVALLAASLEPAAGQRPTWGSSARGPVQRSLSVSTRFGNARSYSRTGRSCSRRAWIPGRFENVRKRVWVAGGVRRQWIPDRYETRYRECGTTYRVLVQAGHWTYVEEPGRWSTRVVRVWRPGHWSYGR